MACRVIPSITNQGMAQSKTWSDIYNIVKDESKTDKLYEQLKQPTFKSWFGNWVDARGAVQDGTFDQLSDAENAFNVQYETNEEGEPALTEMVKNYLLPKEERYSKDGTPQYGENDPKMITDVLGRLKTKFGIPFSTISDEQQKWNAKLSNREVIVNLAYARPSDAWHEYSHPFLMYLRKHHQDVFDKLFITLRDSKEYREIFEQAGQNTVDKYPELKNSDDYAEEIMAQAIGWAAHKKYSSFSEKFRRFIDAIMTYLRGMFGVAYNDRITYVPATQAGESFSRLINELVRENNRINVDDYHLEENSEEIGNVELGSDESTEAKKLIEQLGQEQNDLIDQMMDDSNYSRSEALVDEASDDIVEQIRKEAPSIDQLSVEEIGRKVREQLPTWDKRRRKKIQEVHPDSLQGKIRDFTFRLTISNIPDNIKRMLSVSEKPFRTSSNARKQEIVDSIVRNVKYVLDAKSYIHPLHMIHDAELRLVRHNSLGKEIIETKSGYKFPITTKFSQQLMADPNGKTDLTKPFSSSEGSQAEKEVLKEFYDFYMKEINTFFEGQRDAKNEKLVSQGKKPTAVTNVPSSIDNKRLLNKFTNWLNDNYGIYHFDTEPTTFTYGLNSIRFKDKTRLGQGYEVLVSNGYLLPNYVHTENAEFTSEGGETVKYNSVNAVGWYIYHELFGEEPLFYEFQSDVIDELDKFERTYRGTFTKADKLKVFGSEVDSMMTSIRNTSRESIIDSVMENVGRVEQAYSPNKYASLISEVIEAGSKDYAMKAALAADKAVAVLEDQILKLLSNISSQHNFTQRRYNYINVAMNKILNTGGYAEMSEFVLDKLKPHEASLLMQTARQTPGVERDEIQLDIYNPKVVRAFLKELKTKTETPFNTKVSNSGFKDRMKKLRAARLYAKLAGEIANLDDEIYAELSILYNQGKQLQKERIETFTTLIAASAFNKLYKDTNLAMDSVEYLQTQARGVMERLESLPDSGSTSDPAIDNLIKQLKQLKSNQLKLFITHAILYAKGKGKDKVIFPTAELIDTVESGDPWTLYVTPWEKESHVTYKGKAIGSFYEALQSIPNLDIKYKKNEQMGGIHVLEVDISKFNSSIERFSKLDNKQDPGTDFSSAVLGDLRIANLVDSKRRVVAPYAETLPKLEEVDNEFYHKYGVRPFVIVRTATDFEVSPNEEAAQFVNDFVREPAPPAVLQFMDTLKEKLGVDYEIISFNKALALATEAGVLLDNRTSFFYKGKVHIVEGGVTMQNAIHEFAHPLVAALRTTNPQLYSSISTEISMSSPFHTGVVAQVVAAYRELESASVELNDEIIVHALTMKAQGLLNAGTENKGFWSRLWYGIKQALRKAFGKDIVLDRLNEKTSLEDLAKMLVIDTKNIKGASYESDFMFFNKELTKDLEKIEGHKILKHIDTMSEILRDHINKLYKNKNRNYAELREVLRNEYDGSILTDASKLLEIAEKLEKDIDSKTRGLRNLAEAIIGVSMISDKMRAYVDEFNDRGMTEPDQLRVLRYYGFMISDWERVFEDLDSDNRRDLPELQKYIDSTKRNFRAIKDYTIDMYKKGLVQMLVKELGPIKSFVDRQYPLEIERLTQLAKEGNKTAAKRLIELKKEHEKFDLSEEHILRMLEGEMGDTNAFSAYFESYTSSPDPIVAGFASYLQKSLYRVESHLQAFSMKFRNSLDAVYKKHKIDRSSPEELGKSISFVDKIYGVDDKGDPKAIDVHVLLHEFGNGWHYDYKTWEAKVKKAQEGGNREEMVKVKREFLDFQEKYFHRQYTDNVYKAKNFWWENAINQKAYKKRKEITDQIASYKSSSGVLVREDIEDLERLQKDLQKLGSTRNEDGSEKVGEDLEIAQAIKKYSELSKGLYEEYEIRGAFGRARKNFEDNLEMDFDKNSSDYKTALNAWLKENTRIKLSAKFYEDREKILSQIKAIMDTLPKDIAKELDISNTWHEIFDELKGFRDKDGQPVGSELSEGKIARIKELQEKMIEAKEEMRRLSGLTTREADRFSELWSMIKSGIILNASENQEFNEIQQKKKENSLDAGTKSRLMSLFEELAMFSSKIPTDYYVDRFNTMVKEVSNTFELDYKNSEDTLLMENADSLMKEGSKFKEWFLANHVLKTRWNKDSQGNEMYYERLYIWNRIVPNNADLKDAVATNNFEKLLSLKSPYLEIKPASKYFFFRVKNEHMTGWNSETHKIELKEGVHVDNRGNWLPKTVADGAYDDRYENKRYFQLKNSTDERDKGIFSILETYKTNLLAIQKEAPTYTKLYLEVPRIRREALENVDNIVGNTKASIGSMLDWVKTRFSPRAQDDAFDVGQITPDQLKDENKLYVMTDNFGSEIYTIPMKYMHKMDTQLVSMDIGRSIIKYASAIETNKELHKMSPIGQALQEVLAEHGVKDINKIAKRSFFSKIYKGAPKVRSNVRLQAINNMIERDFHGIESKMELGLWGNKVASQIMGLAAWGTLTLNVPTGIKNAATARVQNILHAVTGEEFRGKDWATGSSLFLTRYWPAFLKDYNKFAHQTQETQLFELFDPVQGTFQKEIGEEFSASHKKDIVNLRFTTSLQKFGELNAQGSAFLAMMLRQQVPITEGGNTRMIPYLDAWTLVNGVITLKEGVSKAWDKDGESFLAFKLKMHKVNELLQGAYAKANQPEIARYTTLRMILFMRRYLSPGIVKRFATKRVNSALGRPEEGHYVAATRLLIESTKSLLREGRTNWHVWTPREKADFWRTLAEVSYSFLFLLLLSLLGYDGDDPHRNSLLKEKAWAHQMLIYELLMVKGETETFVPLPGFGMNEILRLKDQPSIAFPIINKYYKLFYHMGQWMSDPVFGEHDATFKRDTGMWDKGDLKWMADLMKVIGYTGNTVDPRQGIINYNSTMNRYQ